MDKQRIQELIHNAQFDDAKRDIIQLEDKYGASDVDIITMKASIAVAENNLEEAKRVLLGGLNLAPDDDDILYNLGYVYMLLEDYQQSNYYFEQLLIHSKDNELLNEVDQLVMKNKQHMLKNHPLVSIVILAYNKLDYTKLCIESIFKYTNHLNYELIAVNNGSTDGTKEYFDSLPNVRALHLEENVGVSNGFNEGMKIAKGKYTACVCNDFIFTPRWLDNLLTCIESDESIGYVSPGASLISNYQQINGTYSNIEEMFQFAEKYNVSDPRKWEERIRLMPCVLMVRTELLKKIGYYDPAFYFGEFADDDISFRIRRAGYKLVFCKDTFTYHFGSVTVRDDQVNNNSMEISREIFRKKYNLDSWQDAVFKPVLLNELSVKLSMSEASILGINSKCGGNPLQLKNMLKEKGVQHICVTNYCIDEKYIEDIKTVSDVYLYGDVDQIKQKVDYSKFDYIFSEIDIDQLKRNPNVIEDIGYLLKQEGQLALSLTYQTFNETEIIADIQSIQKIGLRVTFHSVIHRSPSEYDLILVARKDV